jgi:hypothetical protein
MYDLLFQTVSQVLQAQVGAELGCQIGLTLVLHTWGQPMDEHYHLHGIVTGGGLRLDGQKWVKARGEYLVDVVALSAAYRDKLLGGIEKLYRQGQLSLEGAAAELDVPGLLAELRAKKWEVFIKPFATPEAVTEYPSTSSGQA